MSSSKQLAAIGGVVAIAMYVASAIWSALFIPSIPMASDWCLRSAMVETNSGREERVCVEFKNPLEEAKYNHNVALRERNRKWVYASIAIGALVGGLLQWLAARMRQLEQGPLAVQHGLLMGAGAALFGPLLLSWLLPPPAEWFPHALREAHDARVDAAVVRLLDGLNEDAGAGLGGEEEAAN